MFKKILSVFIVVLSFFVAVSTVTPVMAQASCKLTISHPTATKVDGDISTGCGNDLSVNKVEFVVTGTKLATPIVHTFPGNHGGYNFDVNLYGDGQLCIYGYSPKLNPNPQGECFPFGNPVNPPQSIQPSATAQTVVAATATPVATVSGDTQVQSQGAQTYGPNDCPQGTKFVPVRYGKIMKIQTQSGQLNLRTEAGTQNPALMLMTEKSVILSLQETKCAFGDIWMNVGVGEVKGWAAYQGKNQYFFLKADETSSVATATPSGATPTATALKSVGMDLAQVSLKATFVQVQTTTDVYSSSGDEAKVIATAPAGAIFIPVGFDGKWLKVKWAQGKEGWILGATVLMMVNDGRTVPTVVPTATQQVTAVATTTMEATPTPESLGPVSMVCGIAPAPQLILGAAGHNAPDQGKTNVRLTPRGESIYEMEESQDFMVLKGIVNYTWEGQDYSNVDATPRCETSGTDGSLVWYLIQVTLDDGTTITGWSPEGTGKDGTAIYWLLPG